MPLDTRDEFCLLPQALPIVVFFSSIMSVLYFLGIMQWLILKVGTCAAQHRRLSCPSLRNEGPCVLCADLLADADNNGNLSHRDLERSRQYICRAGTLTPA